MVSKISIICPARNESESVSALVGAINSIKFSTQVNFNNKVELEFLIIDNASDDDTIEKLNSRLKNEPFVKIIRNVRNLGFQNSILKGLRNATGDAAIILQFDLQDPPEIIQEMIRRWIDGDKYIVTKIRKRNSGFIDALSRTLGYIFIRTLSGTKIKINSSDFWLLDRSIIDQINTLEIIRPFFRTLLPKFIKPSSVIEYDRNRRISGHSNFNFMAKLEFFIDALLTDTRRIALIYFLISGFSLVLGIILTILLFVKGGIEIYFIICALITSISTFFSAITIEFLWRMYSDTPIKNEF